MSTIHLIGIPAATISVGVLVAAVTDLWKFKVYNLLTLPLLLSGLLYYALVRGLPGLEASALGALFGFLVLLPFYLLGGMGGGDVKLMAAVGAWLGLPLTFCVFIVSSLAAGAYAVALLATHGHWRHALVWSARYRLSAAEGQRGGESDVQAALSSGERRKRCIPFAAMMAVGVCATLVFILAQG